MAREKAQTLPALMQSTGYVAVDALLCARVSPTVFFEHSCQGNLQGERVIARSRGVRMTKNPQKGCTTAAYTGMGSRNTATARYAACINWVDEQPRFLVAADYYSFIMHMAVYQFGDMKRDGRRAKPRPTSFVLIAPAPCLQTGMFTAK